MEEGFSLDLQDQEDLGIETLRGNGYMTCKEKKKIKQIIIVGVAAAESERRPHGTLQNRRNSARL
jgi:hypothetical protein